MSAVSRFARKSMVVTGAAQGIGKQVAIDAAGEGARVTLVDRSPLVETVAAEIAASGGQAVSFVADLETWESNLGAMKTAHKAYGAVRSRRRSRHECRGRDLDEAVPAFRRKADRS